MWWSWTAPSLELFTISTFGSKDAYDDVMDTILAVYTGTDVADLALKASDDDFGGDSSSAVLLSATAGTTISDLCGWLGDGTAGNIILTVTTALRPMTCLPIAVPITGASATVNGNTGATLESGEPLNGGATVWWTWTAPAIETVIIDTLGSSFDTVLGVYVGTNVTALTTVATNDNSNGAETSSVTFSATKGTAYQIAVDGSGGDYGLIKLNIRTGVVPPVITIQPASTLAALGSSVSFAVAATGTAPLVYQWSVNGNAIYGATKATLTLSHVQFSDAGSYTVQVRNPADSTDSSNAVLTVTTDAGKPGVAITGGPAANARVTNANVIFQGATSQTARRLLMFILI